MSSAAAKSFERFPWEPESVNRANLATAGLRRLLVKKLSGRAASPLALLIAVGSLVGCAAQNAALEQGELLTARRDLVGPESLMLRPTKDGRRFLAGRWINAPLLLGYGHAAPLQRFVVQAASAAGVKRDQFPDFWEMERKIAKACAEGEVGVLESAPLKPESLLKVLWPAARKVVTAPMPMEVEDEPILHEAHWPTLISLLAGRMIAATAEAVEPRVAASLVMEAAIVASKLDPDTVEPGRWTLSPGSKGLQIRRDDRRRYVA